MPLTPKQLAFADEYLIDCIALQAALRAGYSRKAAKIMSWKWKKNPILKKLIDEKMATRSARLQLNQDRILQEIVSIALTDPRRLYDNHGRLLPIKDWPPDVAAAVSSIKSLEYKNRDGSITGEIKEIKFWDKGKQLDLAARHLGLYSEKNEHNTSIAQLIREARLRLIDTKPS